MHTSYITLPSVASKLDVVKYVTSPSETTGMYEKTEMLTALMSSRAVTR